MRSVPSQLPPQLFLTWPDTLVMEGDIDFSVVRWFAWPDRVHRVTTVDVSAATHLDASAVGLVRRCVMDAQRGHPPRVVQVIGASPAIRSSIDLATSDLEVSFIDVAED